MLRLFRRVARRLLRLWRGALFTWTPFQNSADLVRVFPKLYLRGDGIEIGALHQPLAAPPAARVRFVDRMDVAGLRQHYPELADLPLVEPDIIDDGEKLTTLGPDSQDFVIASHFLEHCQDPIGTLKAIFRVMRPGGMLYLALPDKRYTFDRERPVTPLAHLWTDHRLGPEQSLRDHAEEYARCVNGVHDPVAMARQADRIIAHEISIHYHVWTQKEMLELLLAVKDEIGFEIEAMCKNHLEAVFVLQKAARTCHETAA